MISVALLLYFINKEAYLSQCDILVVDDDESLLTLISLRLRAQGWRVEACNSAQSALIALDACLPRLVITDLLMPEMNGIELFEQIHSRYPTLPVILLTAHGTIPDAIDATRRGVFGFLTKPFEKAFKTLPDELIEKFGLEVLDLFDYTIQTPKK